MNHNKRKKRSVARRVCFESMCGAINADDGLDPRDYVKVTRPKRKKDYKTLQLCRQVLETLDQVLSGECADELLQSLCVRSVTPAPNASQLLVVVGCRDNSMNSKKREILQRLERRSGWLRSELANAIHRKKVPRLHFLLL